MSDQCPIDLHSYHPVILAEQHRQRVQAKERARMFAEADSEDEEEEEEEAGDMEYLRGGRHDPPPPCWARLFLAFFSLLGAALGATILVYPALSYKVIHTCMLVYRMLMYRMLVFPTLVNAHAGIPYAGIPYSGTRACWYTVSPSYNTRREAEAPALPQCIDAIMTTTCL